MSKFLANIGAALRTPGLGDRLQAALAAAGGDTGALARLRALQLQRAEFQRRNDARDAQVIGAKNLGFSNDEIGAMGMQDLSLAARQRMALGAGQPSAPDKDGGATLDRAAAIQHAAEAVRQGADPAVVRSRLHEMGQTDLDPPSPFADLIPDERQLSEMISTSGMKLPVKSNPTIPEQGMESAASPQTRDSKLQRRSDPVLAPRKISGFPKYAQSIAGEPLEDHAAEVGRALAESASQWAAGQSRRRTTVQRPAPQPPARWREGGRWNRETVYQRAARAVRMFKLDVARGRRPEEAAGWAASSNAESGGDYRFHQPSGPGFGLYQWGVHGPRAAAFQHLFGHSIEQSTEAEQLAFRDWELAHTEARAAANIARAQTAGDAGDAITRYYERPKARDRDAADRANVAEAIMRLMAQSQIAPKRAGRQVQGISVQGSGPVRY